MKTLINPFHTPDFPIEFYKKKKKNETIILSPFTLMHVLGTHLLLLLLYRVYTLIVLNMNMMSPSHT